MKLLVKILRIIIIFYLFLITLLAVIIYSKKTTFEEKYPTILGYSYFKADSEILSPDIKKGSIVLLKEEDIIKKDDYVIVYGEDKKDVILRKVISKDGDKLKLDITNYIDDKDYSLECKTEDVLSKVVYNNNIFSAIMNVLINPIFILILLFVGTILPELLFND